MRACVKCGVEKGLDDFHRDKNLPEGKSRRCKECANAHSRKWNAENKERKNASRIAWRKANMEKELEITRRWRERNRERYERSNAEYASRNSKRNVARVKKWREDNKDRAAFSRRNEAARRRAALLRACPPWADMERIRALYELAHEMSRDTGVPHDVDHIVPLQGKRVCGLHVHENLRVIPASENRKKSRKENATEWSDGIPISWLYRRK